MRAGDRLYRLLLRAYPRAIRDVEAPEMIRHFRAQRADVRGVARVRLWLRAAVDAIGTGLGERLRAESSITDARRMPAMLEPRAAAHPFSGLGKDIRWGARRLRRAPGFATLAVLTLALGIGATTTIFSVVQGVLLAPLPFAEPARVVGLFQVWEGRRDVFSSPNFLDVERRARSFSSAAAYTTHGATLTDAGDPVRLVAAETTANFFAVLQRPPLYGRLLGRDDNAPGHTDVVVLSYDLWAGRFGADPTIVGRSIQLDGIAQQVVGVMPAGATWPLDADVWMPAEYTENFTSTNRGAWSYDAFGRLAPGVTVEAAAREVADIGRGLEREHTEMNHNVGMTAFPIVDDMLGDTKRALLVLLAAVGLVLLLACVNVANLVLARATSGEADVAVRAALGAGRWRLARQVLVESLLLAVVGGVAGLAMAAGGLRVLHAVRPAGVPRLETVALNPAVLAFAFAVTALTGIVFGLLPALHAASRSLADSLRERGRSGAAGRRSQRTRQALVAVEMAIAVLLLVGAGLTLRSFINLLHVDPGFRVGRALTFRLGLPGTQYKDDAQRLAFFDQLETSLRALPGVIDAGAALFTPPTPPTFNLSFEISGHPKLNPADQPAVETRIVDASFFRVMGIPIRRGRAFTDQDRAGSTPVLLIAESMAARYFPGEDPIGRHITIGWRRAGGVVQGDVVGIVADAKSVGLDRDAPPMVYVPMAQQTVGNMSFVVRTAVPPETLFGAVRAAVAGLDPRLPVARMETMEAHVAATISERRFYMLLLGVFASLAVLLAAVGVFGVLSFLVAQRTREIGIRLALGAGRAAVTRLILRQTIGVAGFGVAAGTAAGVLLTRLMAAMLFQVAPNDVLTYAVVDVILLGVAAGAAWVPVRRAVRIDPTTALRAN